MANSKSVPRRERKASPVKKSAPAKKPAAPAKEGKPSASKLKDIAPKTIELAEPASASDSEPPPSQEAAEDKGGGDEVIEVEGEVLDVGAPIQGEGEGESFDIRDDVGEDLFARGPKASSDSAFHKSAALSRVDPLQAYLREIQRHPLLTPDEERTLTTHYAKTGDVKTAARLVTANLRLVVKLAYEYRRAYKNIMDLIQEGNIGLMQAVKHYDPYRGVKLSSYSAWWIRAYILRFILNNWRLVKLGTTQAQRKLFFNLSKEKSKLSAMGIEPTTAEIAQRLNVDEAEVIDMDRRLSSSEASLDAPVGDAEGRPISRVELLPSAVDDPDTAFQSLEVGALLHEHLERFRSSLKGKDIVIFDKRLRAEDPLTLQELGDEFGISRERVRQLEARLTNKLRTYLKEQLGDAVEPG